MVQLLPTPEEWRRLYDAAIRIKNEIPWESIKQTDIFGVQFPETNEIGFVSVTGALGEHFSITVYLGTAGLYGFYDLLQDYMPGNPERLLEIPQLQVSFENRLQLDERDREIIKLLGLKFRGRHAWPMFRSFSPGYFPWFLDMKEVAFLATVLEQTLNVIPRYMKDPSIFPSENDNRHFIRTHTGSQGGPRWRDTLMELPPPEAVTMSIPVDGDLLEEVARIPPIDGILELDLFLFPATIQEESERPYYPYMFLVVDNPSGLVVGSELLKVETTLQDMWCEIPETFIQMISDWGAFPRHLSVKNSFLLDLFMPLMKDLGLAIKQSDEMPLLERAKETLIESLRIGREPV
ncbi:MAG: hypothetical protein KJ970_19485 [Candidatus Eisenbacteria bacterium]|uniref:Uncharacterized protein n=1 Tax=Eiseniibacteriota bacterium TaxID=2212470 RepID=A0A948RYC5_UNCEI|nr:hypothetical protein [Candidatus Eisenbacteria bacterium]MBU1948313.1 hypothetical protein [Candidatus Eisenbacteria bacterium]MBU2693105.1 hypothetical protein [Candidatus Eisenbacteria bacterium]